MGWFKNLFKTQEDFSFPAKEPVVPTPQSIVLTSALPKSKPYTFGNLRNNRWVVVDKRVGIVTSFEPELSTVDFVDEGGFTIYTERVHTAFIRLARWAEIPKSRIYGLTNEDGQRLGYHL